MFKMIFGSCGKELTVVPIAKLFSAVSMIAFVNRLFH
jgi:hypothetical protein